ncbi:uncharacterized protein MELLADRAFT_71832 [Melampsora larici-populina 98AG31]|uniref:Cysteine-rich PDZ-binding protein n=1 Tax=Melampsora larici-populina (strain 98AG31 / pathotype 3-4-7) TaxID=747676 RepID=F4RKV9_MELLP|nr:uncharacterized protein MELLADRAFT_71832 [Melampsora larici-populina 98AG31]EGG06969.1 hypothetical protein MELLADRAFT_71832 [Melampsora larici-populina 98AG31]
MVCEKCNKKLSKNSLATPEVRGIAGSSNAIQNQGRKIGENKLLSSKNRYNPYQSTSASSSLSKKSTNPSIGIGKCLTCKSSVARNGAKYCQNCSFKKGICGMCGKIVTDITYSKQTAK